MPPAICGFNGNHGEFDPPQHQISTTEETHVWRTRSSRPLEQENRIADRGARAGLNIEASYLWYFFQAKTIRGTVLKTAAEEHEAQLPGIASKKVREQMEKNIAAWKKAVARYESEPETNEGRKELAARAKAAEQKRDTSLAAYHHFEVASAGVQIAIVLASAAVITSAMWLTWIACGLGIIGIIFSAIGLLWPTAVHLF
jgi:hypothetical protein